MSDTQSIQPIENHRTGTFPCFFLATVSWICNKEEKSPRGICRCVYFNTRTRLIFLVYAYSAVFDSLAVLFTLTSATLSHTFTIYSTVSLRKIQAHCFLTFAFPNISFEVFPFLLTHHLSPPPLYLSLHVFRSLAWGLYFYQSLHSSYLLPCQPYNFVHSVPHTMRCVHLPHVLALPCECMRILPALQCPKGL